MKNIKNMGYFKITYVFLIYREIFEAKIIIFEQKQTSMDI